MRLTQIQAHIQANKNLYLWSLLGVTASANALVSLTYQKTGAINFSFLTYKLLFEAVVKDSFAYEGVGVPILFGLANLLWLYLTLLLILSRFRLLGWILSLLFIASLLPIINFSDIFI